MTTTVRSAAARLLFALALLGAPGLAAGAARPLCGYPPYPPCY